jgi:hypothetical protein
MADSSLEKAARLVDEFGAGPRLTSRIRTLESAAQRRSGRDITSWLEEEGLTEALWESGRAIKTMAGQINALIHTVGILISLPHILDADEVVERLSLGAGNTGRDHDLETDRQIAEFKFIDWRGGPESIRQNSLFFDVFGLVNAMTEKRRLLYLLGTTHAERFLRGGRAIGSVLSRNAKARRAFYAAHGDDTYPTVGSYWATVEHLVELKDLRELVPTFSET